MAGFSLPTVGQPNSTEDAKVLTALTGLNDLAAAYRTLLTMPAGIASVTAGTYTFTVAGNSAASGFVSSTFIIPVELLAADHAVTGLSTKLRVKLMVEVGATSSGTSVQTAGLYPITIAAGNVTMGTVVSGSTAAASGLSANTINRVNSGDFTFPTDGPYVLGIVVSGSVVPTGFQATAALQVRNV